jgi:DNA mismatch repair protein MutL
MREMPTSFSADPPVGIRLLDDAVISGIAAGEVVERPASIVKELIENALDADARRIEIRIDDAAGKSRLEVIDDGGGIRHSELELAVTRHATSKISDLDDLRRIGTFGFRGEALASIGAVSELEVSTRTAADSSGASIRIVHGKTVDVHDVASRRGTSVAVSDLFANVPARRKFLKTAAAEFSAIADAVRRLALANADIHFRLVRNGKTHLDLPATGRLVARLRQVYGDELAGSLAEVDASHGGMRLHGVLSNAGVSFGSGRRVSLFINRRWVNDRTLFRAVMEGYRTYLLKGRYPAAALFLGLAPDAVDVNVHPSKLEVRFEDPEAVSRFVAEAVTATLRGVASPLGRWGLAESDVARSESELRRRKTSSAGATPGDRGDASVAQPREAGRESSVAEQAPIPGYTPAAGAETEPQALPPSVLSLAGENESPLEVVGQVFAGYIVCQAGEELVLLDQHAAHERVLYERLTAASEAAPTASQPLLLAETVSVGGDAVAAFERAREELSRLGWEIDVFGEEDVVVRAVPAVAAHRNVRALVERLASDLTSIDAKSAGERVAKEIAATVACHAAVRVGKVLDRAAAKALIEEIGTVDFASSCPHGRPVAQVLSRSRIERMFGR